MNGIHEVTGSIPVWSTIFLAFRHRRVRQALCFAARASQTLRCLTASSGVEP